MSESNASEQSNPTQETPSNQPIVPKVPVRPGRVHRNSDNDTSGLLLPFWWDMQKLHSLNIPVTHLPIDDLKWHLSWKVWSNYGVPTHISPTDVRKDPQRYYLHYERTMNAELSFPMYVISWDNRWTILDGIHRLLKADILGERSIPVCIVTTEHLARIIVPPPEEAMILLRALS